MDNLNTDGIGSLYEAFEPAKAFALAQRLEMHHTPELEIHHTPKHGSGLNVAEIGLSALTPNDWTAASRTSTPVPELLNARSS